MLQIELSTPTTEAPEPFLDTSLVVPAEIERLRQVVADYQAGRMEEALFRRFRLQQGIYGIRNRTGVQMVRVKVPYGRLTARQLEALGRVAETYASGHGHITTRQDLQFYLVPLGQVADFLAELGRAGLTSREASGNVVRNVTADPLAGVAADEAFDVRPYADATARYLLRNPICQAMGRKFKISFSGSPADRAFAPIHDVGAIARIAEVDGRPTPGFDIFIGGGLGAAPRLAGRLEPFTPADQLLPTIEAVIRLFDRLGNRKNRNKARLKFLIADMGMEAFRELVFAERAILPLLNAQPYPPFNDEHIGWTAVPQPANGHIHAAPDDPAFRLWQATNVVRQKQPGFSAAFITVPGGDLTAVQFRELAVIAHRFAGGEAVATATQNLALRWVPQHALPDLYLALQAIGLSQPGVNRPANVVGCPGADTCNLAITTSHRLALELNRRLSAWPDMYLDNSLEGIDIKVSGCPNSCAHHHLAAIGLHGSVRRLHGRQVPHYRLLLGGRVGGNGAVFGAPVAVIPAGNVPAAVERVLTLYRLGRQPDENFFDWIDRTGVAFFKGAFKDLQILPAPEEAPQMYQDWGQETAFALQVGEGECAA